MTFEQLTRCLNDVENVSCRENKHTVGECGVCMRVLDNARRKILGKLTNPQWNMVVYVVTAPEMEYIVGKGVTEYHIQECLETAR